MCQHPARQPTGGEFLIGNLAKKFLGSFHSYVKKTIITFCCIYVFIFYLIFLFFYFAIALTRGQPVQMGILWEVFIGQGKTIGCITSKRLDENVWGSFDGKGLSECKREGYYMAGIFRGKCDKLYCLEEF